MGAIYGLLNLDGAALKAESLAAMGLALALHGPDAGVNWTGHATGLGHRLMERCDPVHARAQPVAVRGGEVVLVADGHVDNRSELGRALGLSQAELTALSDADLMARAYARWEQESVRHLVGEFAFAVWDGTRRSLVLACSAPLARPLCYHRGRGVLAFATRARGLFALEHIESRIDEERIAGYLASVNTGRTRSFFEDIHRLLPGHLLIADDRGVRVQRWWEPDLSARLRLPTDEDYVEAFDELFERVVADHLRGVERPALMLSGGLDSASIAAEAARQRGLRGLRLQTYTEAPPPGFAGPVMGGRYADETEHVRALAGMYRNIDLELIRARHGLLDDLDPLFTAAEVPFRNAANRSWFEAIFARARDAGVTTLLTGSHGNLTVSWAGSGLLAELVRTRRLRDAVRQANALAGAGGASSTWRALLGQGVRPLLPGCARRMVESLRRGPGVRGPLPWEAHSLIHPVFAAEHRLAERTDRMPRMIDGDGRAMRAQALLGTGGLEAELLAGYRALYGISSRGPLADRRLVEFCLSVPEEQFARDGETRWLIRRAMSSRLPVQILHARHRGLQAADWFEQMGAERPALLEEVARFAHDDLASRVLDLARLRRLLERWPSDTPTEAGDVHLYRGAIGMALMTGRFMLWAQRS